MQRSSNQSGPTEQTGEFRLGGPSAVAAGCLQTLASAAVTCALLFVNGSLVMAILTAIAKTGPPWVSDTRFSQFVLFAVPVLLAILQWKMFDYVRLKLRPKRHR